MKRISGQVSSENWPPALFILLVGGLGLLLMKLYPALF